MSASLMSEGVELMLLGMGTVFVFLTLLVFVTTFMSSLVQKYFPEPVSSPASDSQAPGARVLNSNTLNSNTLLAVISAAIHEHRSRDK